MKSSCSTRSDTDEIDQIVDKFVRQVEHRLKDRSIGIELTPEAKSWIAERGYDTWMGARPMARAMQRYIESPLALALIKGEISDGSHVVIDIEEDRIVFRSETSESRVASKELSEAISN